MRGTRIGSFDILNLLPDLFQFPFQLDDVRGNFGVVRFGSDRIDLPSAFLQEKIQCTADGLLAGERCFELAEMRAETRHFLGNIASLRIQGLLLRKPPLIKIGRGREFVHARF